VERGDFGHFLSLYTPDRLPAGRRLRNIMDRIVFCIEGYDDDPREIHSIPEIRRFLFGLPRRLAVLALLLQT